MSFMKWPLKKSIFYSVYLENGDMNSILNNAMIKTKLKNNKFLIHLLRTRRKEYYFQKMSFMKWPLKNSISYFVHRENGDMNSILNIAMNKTKLKKKSF